MHVRLKNERMASCSLLRAWPVSASVPHAVSRQREAAYTLETQYVSLFSLFALFVHLTARAFAPLRSF